MPAPEPAPPAAAPREPWTPQRFAAAIDAFFAPGGQLAATKAGYEPRPQQLALAQAVGAALLQQQPLLAEAGTGTGKTLAYLVPALLSRLKVLISTATKQLQEQILLADVPAIAAALGRPVDVVVLKGRRNYLCELRCSQALPQLGQQPEHAATVRAVQRWRGVTQTGERSECAALPDEAPLWRQLTATREQCVGRSCSFYDRCYVVQARRRAQQADLVVVNHHLFFADVAMGSRGSQVRPAGLLPPYEAAIFDEAHELDDIASQHFGHGLSDAQLRGLLDEVARRAEQAATLPDLTAVLTRARAAVAALYATLTPGGRHLLQVGAPDVLAERSRQAASLDDALAYLEAELTGHSDEESRQLGERLGEAARTLATVLRRPARAGLLHGSEDWGAYAGPAAAARGDAQAGDAAAPARPDAADLVHFGEVSAATRLLAARPVDVAQAIGELFAQVPCVFLSATLQLGGSFAHTRRRLGLAEDTPGLAQQSPFDFARQAAVYVACDLPEPDRDPRGARAAARAAELVRASGGGALVLCTSHRAMATVHAALRGCAPGPLLLQGEAPKAHLLQIFAARTDAVLVASLGFWRGVDVPGPALRLVIMDRVPFAVPGDPLVQARMAALIQAGLDPFAHYQLPQAALLLRQGFGRLIRRQGDVGTVALLDRRLCSRGYGAQLLQTLPDCPRITDLDEVVRRLRQQATQLPQLTQPPGAGKTAQLGDAVTARDA